MTGQTFPTRYRIIFSKTEAMRFTGNLDLHRTLERSMRRGNLPLAYSQGFNPRPKLTLASALPLGYTSDYEAADFWLNEERTLGDVRQALEGAFPPGIKLNSLEAVELTAAKLQVAIKHSSFVITLLEKAEDLEAKVARLLEAKEIRIEKTRKGKKRVANLRDFIIAVEILPEDEAGLQRMAMTLTAGEGKTARPDDILLELGIDPLEVRVHRVGMVFGE